MNYTRHEVIGTHLTAADFNSDGKPAHDWLDSETTEKLCADWLEQDTALSRSAAVLEAAREQIARLERDVKRLRNEVGKDLTEAMGVSAQFAESCEAIWRMANLMTPGNVGHNREGIKHRIRWIQTHFRAAVEAYNNQTKE